MGILNKEAGNNNLLYAYFKQKKSGIQRYILLIVIIITYAIYPESIIYANELRSSIAIFAGQATENDIGDWPESNYGFQDSYLAGIGINHQLRQWERSVLEAEAMISQHFGGQDYTEFNALLVFRWLIFPWDKYIDTTFAVGEGLSYADAIPEIEAKYHLNTNKLLNFVLVELEFSLYDVSRWSLVLRWHHRSGVFGLFNDVWGASDFFVSGLRFKF